jgi:ribonuclease P protein component
LVNSPRVFHFAKSAAINVDPPADGAAPRDIALSARFRPAQRLLKPAEFERLFKQGKRHSTHYLTMLWALRPDEAILSESTGVARRALGVHGPRLGFAVAKKAVPDAVGRNRIKRLVRDHFRRHAAELGSVDFVIMAKPHAALARNEQLHGAIESCWAQLKKHCSAR